MDLSVKKIQKAIKSLESALEKNQKGEKRLSVCDLDYAKDFIQAAIHITIAEMEEEE